MINRSFEINGDAVGTEGHATAEQITEKTPRGNTPHVQHVDELGFTKTNTPGTPFNGVSD